MKENLVSKGNRVLSKDGEDNWERIFGKKELPGEDRKDEKEQDGPYFPIKI
ncbi:MAG: hypothetical protein GY841_16190 [FCB group bacterium]|nr:hypothetical protein [FCB group bacterium]